MHDVERSLKEWDRRYDDYEPLYRAFLDKLEALVREVLNDAWISYEMIFGWLVKSSDFFWWLTRAAQEGRRFEDPFKDLAGFANLTIVVPDNTRAAMVAEAIADVLVTETRDWADAPSDTARYEFSRFAVSIDETRASLPEWRAYEELVVELEIQTVLQYAWELLDNDLPWQYEDSYPKEIQQLRVALAGRLESTDTDVDEIWSALADASERYREDVTSGSLTGVLNAESLQVYLRHSETIAVLVELAIAAGLERYDDYIPSSYGIEHGTLWLARKNDIHNLADLDDFLLRSRDRAAAIFHDIARTCRSANYEPSAISTSAVEWLILVLRRADSNTVALMGYADAVEDALNTVIGNPVTVRSDEA